MGELLSDSDFADAPADSGLLKDSDFADAGPAAGSLLTEADFATQQVSQPTGGATSALASRRLKRLRATGGFSAPQSAQAPLTRGQREGLAAQGLPVPKPAAAPQRPPDYLPSTAPGAADMLRMAAPEALIDVLDDFSGAPSVAAAGPPPNPDVAQTAAPPPPMPDTSLARQIALAKAATRLEGAPRARTAPPQGAEGAAARAGQALAEQTLQPPAPTASVPAYADIATGQDPEMLRETYSPEVDEAILKHRAASTAGPLDPKRIGEMLDTPQAQAAMTVLGAQYGLSPGFVRSGAQTAAALGAMATDPKMAAIGAAARIPVVGPVLSAGLAIQMAHDLITQKAPALGEAIGSGDTAATADIAGQALPELLMAGMAGAHGVRGGGSAVVDAASRGMGETIDKAFAPEPGSEPLAGEGIAQAISGELAKQRVAAAGLGPEGPASAQGPFEAPPDVKAEAVRGPERRSVPRGTDRRAQVAEETGLPEDHPAVDRIVAAEDLAQTHEKSGLPNNRAYTEAAKNYGGFGMLDVKAFKWFNDLHGQTEGDAVIRHVGDVARAIGLGDDVFGVGGDEFKFGGRDVAEAQAKADALQSALLRTRLEARLPDGSVRTYIGIPVKSLVGGDPVAVETGLKSGSRGAQVPWVAEEPPAGDAVSPVESAAGLDERGQPAAPAVQPDSAAAPGPVGAGGGAQGTAEAAVAPGAPVEGTPAPLPSAPEARLAQASERGQYSRGDTVGFRGKTWEVEDVQGGYILGLRRLTSGGIPTFERKTIDVRNAPDLTLTERPKRASAQGEREYKTSVSQRLAATLPSEVKGVRVPQRFLDGINDLSTSEEAKAAIDTVADRLRSATDPGEQRLLRALSYLTRERAKHIKSGLEPLYSTATKLSALYDQRAIEKQARAALKSGEAPSPSDGISYTNEQITEAAQNAAREVAGGDSEGRTEANELPESEGATAAKGLGEARGPVPQPAGEAAIGGPEQRTEAGDPERLEQDRNESGGISEDGTRGGPPEGKRTEGETEGAAAAEGAGDVGAGTRLLDPAVRAAAAGAERAVTVPDQEALSVGAAAPRGFARRQNPTVMDWLMSKMRGRPEPPRIHSSVKAHLADIFGHDTLHEARELDPTRQFDMALAKLAGSDKQAAHAVLTAQRGMLNALGGDETELWRVHRYLLDGALQDEKLRWRDMAKAAGSASDDALLADAERGDFATPLAALDRTSAFAGASLEKGLADRVRVASNAKDPVAMAAAVADLRAFVKNAAEAAAASIGRVDLGADANGAPIDHATYGQRPDVRAAVAQWKKHFSDPVLEAHLANEGAYDPRYAGQTAGARYPLIPLEKNSAPAQDIPRTPFAQARNLQNRYRTGVGTGYSTAPEDLRTYARSVMRRSAQTGVHRTGANLGIMRITDDPSSVPDVMTVRGKTFKTSPLVPLDPWGQKHGYMPEGLYNELKPILLDEGETQTFIGKAMDTAMEVATLGFGEAVLHNFSQIGRYVANTPFLGRGAMKALNTPATKGILAVGELLNMDPKGERFADTAARVAKIGLYPTRAGTMTTDPQLARIAGLELTGNVGPVRTGVSMATSIYGPEGSDLRARVGLANVAITENPDITDAQLFDYLKQIGVYNRQMQSIAARFFKTTKIGQFYTAGYSGVRAGIDAALGTGRTPFGGERGTGAAKFKAQEIASAGLLSAVAYWAAMSKANTGVYPWHDKEAKFLQVRLTPEQRTWVKDHLDVDAGYVSPFAGLSGASMGERGGRLLGLRALFEGAVREKPAWQIELDGLKDFINGSTHMMFGPPLRATMAWLNVQPSIQSLYDKRTGQYGLQLQKMGYGKVQSVGDVAKRMAGGELEAINPTSSAIFKGAKEGSVGRTLADMFPLIKVYGPDKTPTVSPRQQAISDIREGKTPDLSGVRPKGVGALFRDASKSADEVKYQHMPFEKLLDAYDAESDPPKKDAIYRVISQRIPRAMGNLPPATAGSTAAKLQRLR